MPVAPSALQPMLQSKRKHPQNNCSIVSIICMVALLTCTHTKIFAQVDSVSKILLDSAKYAQQNNFDDEEDTALYDNSDAATTTADSATVKAKDTFYVRQVPDSVLYALKKQTVFEYANDPAYWKKQQSTPSPFWSFVFNVLGSSLFKIILYSLLAAILIYVLYNIVVSNKMHLFINAARQQKATAALLMQKNNWDEMLQLAVAQGNYRLAVRYQFLRTLQLLDDRKIIVYHAEATNYEYLRMMRSHKNENEFKFLTQVYEYVWYGEFNITDTRYKNLAERFTQFNNNTHNS
jgi:Domain of unknown function (DUF4129)